ncbi:hypothetical protein [Nocardia sp. 348MFTsu5.1]|uniref:hypothetical protein n=1 Tax=Nocardia sp. 348MFTsu5.1 TaxID=1172185 RepID=UPI000360C5B8|nr:hypothetical protein [Nocardia sp. 348MFTsu5.1]
MTEIAANLGVQPRRSARRGEPAGPAVWRHRLLAAVRAQFVGAEKTDRPKHYPSHYSFIEHAAMWREMDRL